MKASGFSLHADVAAAGYECHKLERLCHRISRPAASERRLSLTEQGLVDELYDVAVLPATQRPMAIGLKTDEIRWVLSVAPSE